MSAAAAAATATASSKATTVSYINRYCVVPVMNTLHKIERRSVAKVAAAEPTAAAWLKEHEATGTDAASTATKQYLHMQGQLLSYRVTRLFEETRHVVSGAYFQNYGIAKVLHDACFLTQLLVVFLIAVMVGRRGVFSPINPDSPLAIALDHKVNPNY